MDYRQRKIIKSSFAIVRPRMKHMMADFYDRLFTRRPDYRTLFPDDMATQHVKFIQFFSQLIGMIDHLDSVNESCRVLGRNHAGYGVQPEDYDVVGVVLLETLENALGEEWSSDLATAWAELYATISSAMISASRQAA
ncbi:MAG TPA: globin domain-containing protein [Fimbriimonadaceae bacterium]|nr:globin domain-containing protein [Fimbriimonadaceae bacterium]HRJ96081.1 globin domain-containing protein [Fimbriimonadaceae bacterium]